LPRDVAVYDLRRLNEWEDVETETSAGDAASGEVVGLRGEEVVISSEDDADAGEDLVRAVKHFDFEVAEFAVDPGQDLLVVVEVRYVLISVSCDWLINRPKTARSYSMLFHLLSLSTGLPHPMAATSPIEWPTALARRKISLSFQICDDGFFVLSQRNQREGTDQLCGWQWTTGRLAVVSDFILFRGIC
jgi:hypothetical protein